VDIKISGVFFCKRDVLRMAKRDHFSQQYWM
jgi:hypothetical protein